MLVCDHRELVSCTSSSGRYHWEVSARTLAAAQWLCWMLDGRKDDTQMHRSMEEVVHQLTRFSSDDGRFSKYLIFYGCLVKMQTQPRIGRSSIFFLVKSPGGWGKKVKLQLTTFQVVSSFMSCVNNLTHLYSARSPVRAGAGWFGLRTLQLVTSSRRSGFRSAVSSPPFVFLDLLSVSFSFFQFFFFYLFFATNQNILAETCA